ADLIAWQAWQMRQRGVKARANNQFGRVWHGRAPIMLTSTGPHGCDLLVALDATTPAAMCALLRPIAHLRGVSVRIASPQSIADMVPAGDWREGHADIDAVSVLATRARATLALGHYLPIGAAAYRGSKPGQYCTVQHGLLTPQAPPLASGTHLLAWSQADADFWRSDRTDVEATTVGSQLLWEAAENQVGTQPGKDARPVYLGQPHHAELDQKELIESVEHFCRETGATYRPDPAKRDRRSLAQQRKWEANGVEIDSGAQPLAELNAPVVSAFSSDILVAAARGLPAWVYHENPPQWLVELWHRYGMHQWGDSPTPAPQQPAQAPAKTIANIVMQMLEA
ncbi:MAG: RNA-binding protein, partial [Nakamurella sp.]